MTDEPNSEYQPLACKLVRMSLLMDGRGETDEERMEYAEANLRDVITDKADHESYGFDEIEAVEVLRDGEPTEADKIRGACAQAIRALEDYRRPPSIDTIVAKRLRSAIGWPRKEEKPNAAKS